MLNPRCMQRAMINSLIFMSNGHISPCCWLTNKNIVSEHLGIYDEELKLKNVDTVEEILLSDQWDDFINKLISHQELLPQECHRECGFNDVDIFGNKYDNNLSPFIPIFEHLPSKEKFFKNIFNRKVPETIINEEREGSIISVDLGYSCPIQCPMCIRTLQPELVKEAKREYGNIRTAELEKLCKFFDDLVFCGTLSDPIYHPKFIELMKIVIEKYKRKLMIMTNGSGKKRDWWETVFQLSRPGEGVSAQDAPVHWFFALDGLPHQSSKYRVNQNGEQVFEMMKMGSDMGCYIGWTWIVFGYNENSIEEGRELAAKHNIVFRISNSERFQPEYKKAMDPTLYEMLKPSKKYYNKD